MIRALTAATVLCVLALTSCSASEPSSPRDRASTPPGPSLGGGPVEEPTAADPGAAPPATVTFDDGDVPAAKEHCAAYVDFNRRVHEQGQKDVSDSAAWEALHAEASAAKAEAPDKFKGLYAVIELWTLELGESRDGSVSPDTKATLGRAVMGNAGVCSAAGVTLPIL
jgi:hypothetical protein